MLPVMQREAERNRVHQKKDEQCRKSAKHVKTLLGAEYHKRHSLRNGLVGRVPRDLPRNSSSKRKHNAKAPKIKCIEKRLYQLLNSVAPAIRKRLLARSFSQQQRLALERWILAQREGISECDVKSTTCIRRTLRRGRRSSTIAKHSLRARRSRTGVYGIQCHLRGKPLYRAKVTAGPFHLVTNYFSDLNEACRRLPALLRIRTCVQHASDQGCHRDSLERTFREALAAEFRHAPRKREAIYGSARKADWHVKFFMTVPAKRWVGKALNTPLFDIFGPSLDAGLQAWHRLCLASNFCDLGSSRRIGKMLDHRSSKFDLCELQSCWNRVRQSFLLVWTEAGRLPHAERHLRKLACNIPHLRTNSDSAASQSDCDALSSKNPLSVSVIVPVARGTTTASSAIPSSPSLKASVDPRATRGTRQCEACERIEHNVEALLAAWPAS